MVTPDTPPTPPDGSSVVAAQLAQSTIDKLNELIAATGMTEAKVIANGIGLLHLIETLKADDDPVVFRAHYRDGRVARLDL